MGPLKWILNFSCLILFFQGYAQVIDASIADQNEKYFITKNVALLTTLQDVPLDSVVLASYQSQFKNIDKLVVFAGYNPYYYWFRFTVKNKYNFPKKVVLLMGPLGLRDAELFQCNNRNCTSLGKTGNQYAFIRRPYQYTHYSYPITLRAQSTDTFYLRIDYGHEYRSYSFALMNTGAMKRLENRVYFSFGIIVGLLLLFFAFNVYLFFAIKERIHLWYALYILMLVLVVLKNDGLDEQFLGWDSAQAYRLTPLLTFGVFAIAALMHVVQLFLVNIKQKSGLFIITSFLKWNLVLSGICHFITFYFQAGLAIEAFVFSWADWSTTIGIVIILVNAVYSVYKGFKGALFILVGLAVFFIGAMERLLTLSTPSYLFPPNLFHIGMIIETFIISFALIYRYNLDRKIKFQSLKEKNRVQNLLDKQILEAKLEMQEQTFKNLSEEIHDNIGQLLSLAKLNISTISSPDNSPSNEVISEVKQDLTRVIQDLRNLSKILNSDFIIEMGLAKSLEFEVELIKKSGIAEVQLQTSGTPYRFDAQKELILFRICQEALNYYYTQLNSALIVLKMNFDSKTPAIAITMLSNSYPIVRDNDSNTTNSSWTNNIRSRAETIGATVDMTGNGRHEINIVLSNPG